MKKLIYTIMVIIFAAALPASARRASASSRQAVTLQVPDDYPTIQSAIDIAVDGDTVIVAPGKYTGDGNHDIDYLGKAITVQSIDPNDTNIVSATIIDCDRHRGFYFHNGEDANSVLSGFTITGEYDRGRFLGVGITCFNSSPTISNCIISDCWFGFRCREDSSEISNCAIYNCTGGIYGSDSCLTISSCTISKCLNAIFCEDGGSTTITNCTFTENQYESFCGGSNGLLSFERQDDVILINCTVTNNLGTSHGRVIFCERCDNITIADCNISNNQIERYSDAVIFCSDFSNNTITNCAINNNTVNGERSRWDSYTVIYLQSKKGKTTVSNCDVYNNEFQSIYCDSNSVAITDCLVADNNGIGIYCSSNSATITDCIITDNGDSGIVMRVSSGKIANCSITQNSSSKYRRGGGITCSGGSVEIDNCDISENTVEIIADYSRGGGIHCGGSNVKITNSTIERNKAIAYSGFIRGGFRPGIAYGGGIYFYNYNSDRSMLIENCIISGNMAVGDGVKEGHGGGGGIFFSGHRYGYTSSLIVNCTITGNSAFPYGGGIFSRWYMNTQITDSILWDNKAPNGDQIALYDEAIMDVNYSDIKGGYSNIYFQPDCILNWGPSNIDVDPMFVESGYWADVNDPNIIVEPNDPNAMWVEGDYHLLAESLCIDAGDPNYVPEPNETDLDGSPRVIGGRIDMGAYEFNPIEAQMKITPQTLNCKSKGKWIKAHIDLPEDILPEDIDVNTPAVLEPFGVESEYIEIIGSDEGPAQIEIGFDRQSFCEAAVEEGLWEIELWGRLKSGRYFVGADTIRIISEGKKGKPRH